MSTSSSNKTGLRRRLVLEAQSPLALLSTRASAQFGKSLDYLPGSAVRGAMAEIFLNKRGSGDPLFQYIFVQRAIRFHDFWPAIGSEPATLLPLSASACKRYKLEHASSLRDRLIGMMTRPNWIDTDDEPKCPECHNDLDQVSGYVYHDNGELKSRKLQRQLRMHVGISRARGSAYHGLLFSYDMLTQKHLAATDSMEKSNQRAEAALAFAGELEIYAEDAEKLWTDFMGVIGNDHLSVGKARTRGLGELAVVEEFTLEREDDFDERWSAFNKVLLDRNASDEYCYFCVTLKSRLILRDSLGRPALDTLGTEYCPIVESISGIERTAAFLNTVMVSGWNAAQGLPKPDMPALARGAVLGFRAKKADEQALKDQLRLLENTGLGERRAEGFGQINVCDSFHVKFA